MGTGYQILVTTFANEAKRYRSITDLSGILMPLTNSANNTEGYVSLGEDMYKWSECKEIVIKPEETK